jgi:hypothetical protein
VNIEPALDLLSFNRMGFFFGMILYPIVSRTKRHRIVVWFLRIAAVPIVVVLFVVLIRNFYQSDPSKACSWCRYLSWYVYFGPLQETCSLYRQLPYGTQQLLQRVSAPSPFSVSQIAYIYFQGRYASLSLTPTRQPKDTIGLTTTTSSSI